MSTPEKKVKDTVRKVLDAAGCDYYFFPATHGYGVSGGFDICCCYYGHFIGIETKAGPSNNPTALQDRNARKAWGAGGSVLLLHKENIPLLSILLRDIAQHKGVGFTPVCIWKLDGSWVNQL